MKLLEYLRWPYGYPTNNGFWGEITSTIDWCEENYVVSSYVAEWSNTLSNSVFVLTALYTTYCSYRNKLEARFILVSVGSALVGIGSWLFHMTLQYKYQLLDELPILYATCIPTWGIICDFSECFERRTGQHNNLINTNKTKQSMIGIFIFSFVTILSVIYIIFKNPSIHQIAYTILNGFIVVTSDNMTRRQVKDNKAKKNIYTSMTIVVIMFAIGFILWNLDNQFCSFWVRLRRNYIKLPFGIFFELHAWWHFLTGTGVYYYIIYLQYQRILLQYQTDQFSLIWRWGVLPEIVGKNHNMRTNYSIELGGPYIKRGSNGIKNI